MDWNNYWAPDDAIDAFYAAIKRGDIKRVQELANEYPKIGRCESESRPLEMFAESHNASEELADFLVSLQPDVFGLESNPIYTACYAGNLRSLRVLLDRGFDPNGEPRFYGTPLHIAVEKKRGAAVEYLLNHGADPGRENEKGLTPIELAEQRGANEIAELLAKYPAERTPFQDPHKVWGEVQLDLRSEEDTILEMLKQAVTNGLAETPESIHAVALHGSGYMGFVECGFATTSFDPSRPDCAADLTLSSMGQVKVPAWKDAYQRNHRVVVEYGGKSPWKKTAFGSTCETLDTPYFRFFKQLLKAARKDGVFDPLPLDKDCYFGVQTFYFHHHSFWK